MPRQRGRRGGGSIKRLPSGKYRAWWSGGLDGSGKRVRKSATFILRGDADWWLREAERQGETPDTGQTVAEYLERWLRTVKPSVRPSTWESYRGHVQDHIIPGLGRIPVTNLQPRHVDEFLADRLAHVSDRTHKPLSPTYVRSILTTLRMALERGVRRRELPDNAAADATAPTVTVRRVEAMTDDEADAIRDATAKTWLGPFVEFMLGSGLRPGEAVGLDQGDLHLDAGYVSLRVSKTEIRAVPLSDDAVDAARKALADAPRRGRHEPVFFGPRPRRTGQRDRLTVWSVTHALKRILPAHKIRVVTAHGLRHGAATIALTHGASLRDIQEQLGHRSPRMTARYAHVVPERQRATAKLLNRRPAAR